jgi:mannose-6-phosphate isomerase-like protein (cupin superfamily)
MIIKNWRDVVPSARKQAAVEWILVTGNDSSGVNKSQKDKLTSHKYISRIWLQPGMVLERDEHKNEEEIFYIASGIGTALVPEHSYGLKNGDTVYIAAGANYQILSEGMEPLEVIAFGADVKKEKLKDRGIVIKNWREVVPWLLPQFHGSGIDWRIFNQYRDPSFPDPNISVAVLPSSGKLVEIKDPEIDEKCHCFTTIRFFSVAMLQPGKSYEPHGHEAEEVYYIINGKGTLRGVNIEDNSTEDFSIYPGSVVVTPISETHQLINDGNEAIFFIAWGGVEPSK